MATAVDFAEQCKTTPILYQSDRYLVVNKPPDLKINSDEADEDTLGSRLKMQFPELVDDTCAHGFRFVHRLDHATSGLICLALNKKGAAKASNAFQQKKVTKHYLALTRGHVEESHMELDLGIGQDPTYTDFRMQCTTSNPNCINAQHSHTTFILLEHGHYEGQPASKVLLIPHTGRTHQLRVHCSHIGHLIVGDYTYSHREDTKPHRMMLHAYHLTIPMAQETISLTTDDPFTSEKDNLWVPDKVYLRYEDYVKDNPPVSIVS